MSKKILYVCIGTLGVGETENAIRFAKDLEAAGFSSHFLIVPYGVPFFKNIGLPFDRLGLRKKENHRIFDEMCQRIKPDWIFIADGYLAGFWLGAKNLFDLEWVIHNPINAPYATFDYFGIGLKEGMLTVFNSPEIEERFRVVHATDLTKQMPVLLPCPFNFSSKPTRDQPNVFHYRRSIELLHWDQPQKQVFKAFLGLEQNEKLILFSIARWALMSLTAFIEGLDAWLQHFARMVEIIFQEIRCKATIIVISSYPMFSNVIKENIKILNLEFLPMEKYIQYLTAADLFITTNAVSNSIIQAIMSNVPVAALISSGQDFRTNSAIPKEMLPWFEVAEQRYPDLIKPYYLFPIGWYEIVNALFENNPITQAFECFDIMEPVQAMITLNELLLNPFKRASLFERQKHYQQALAHLSDPPTLMGKFMDRNTC